MAYVSQKDLAQRLGLNQATVSRALRGDPRISEATRKQVRDAAHEAQYQPDATVARLAARRWRARDSKVSGSIAWLRFEHPEGVYVRTASGEAETYAARYGYQLDKIEVSVRQNIATLARMLQARGYDGIILERVYDPHFVEAFPWAKFTCVSCEVGYVRLPCDHIEVDLRAPYAALWKRLQDAGFHRAGVIMLDERQAPDLFEKLAILNQLARDTPGLDLVEPLFYGGPEGTPYEALHHDASEWLKEHKPDVVLGFNDGTYWVIRRVGLRIPEDIAYVSLMRNPSETTPISGIDMTQGKVAATAIERLDRLIRHYHKGLPENRITISVEPAWVPGKTLLNEATGPR